MQKKLISIILSFVIISGCLNINSINVNAYTFEPYLYIAYNSTANAGDKLNLVYSYYYYFDNERIETTITKQYSNEVVSKTTTDCNHSSDDDRIGYTFTYTIDTTGFVAGNYTVSNVIYYYENGIWKKSSKSSYTAYFTINGKDPDCPDSDIYKSEYVNGKWYDKNGKYYSKSSITWHRDSVGWWMTNEKNWYPTDMWEKINHKWYYFKPDGYMAENEWYNGYWFNSDGAWTYAPKLSWHRDSHGWWVQDSSGWYPRSKWQKIDGYWYYFNSSGYMVVNQYVDGYWLGIDGTYY